MMSRLRANSITLRASASSLESQLLSEILLSNALHILKRTHANADYATQQSLMRPSWVVRANRQDIRLDIFVEAARLRF